MSADQERDERGRTGGSDPRTGALVFAGVVGALLVVLAFLMIQILVFRMNEREAYRGVPEALLKLRADQQAHLVGYRWLDEDAGVVQIPIERAMALEIEDANRPAPEHEPSLLELLGEPHRKSVLELLDIDGAPPPPDRIDAFPGDIIGFPTDVGSSVAGAPPPGDPVPPPPDGPEPPLVDPPPPPDGPMGSPDATPPPPPPSDPI